MYLMGSEAAILLEPYAAVYVEIPKVACSSIKVALADMLGVVLDGPKGDPHQSTFPLATPNRESRLMFEGYFSFSFVRNPWSRLLSCYRDKVLFQAEGFTNSTQRAGVADCFAHYEQIRAGMSFDEFVEAIVSIPDNEADAHFRSQHTFLSNANGQVSVDFVGRFESLNSDLVDVQRRAKMPSFELLLLQMTGTGMDYRDQYGANAQALVESRFAKDIGLFGYTF
ncbi:MAG: chondroitin 4-sulfotransferase 11 [Candidatus Azotimanducaceae bacterium]|jgi:chondroitin 4-sulfotransferase 11